MLVLDTLVLDHVGPDSVLLRFAHSLVLHVVSQEVVQARNFINESKVIHCKLFGESVGEVWFDAFENGGALVVEVDDEVFEGFLVHFEVLHD